MNPFATKCVLHSQFKRKSKCFLPHSLTHTGASSQPVSHTRKLAQALPQQQPEQPQQPQPQPQQQEYTQLDEQQGGPLAMAECTIVFQNPPQQGQQLQPFQGIGEQLVGQINEQMSRAVRGMGVEQQQQQGSQQQPIVYSQPLQQQQSAGRRLQLQAVAH